MVLFFGHTFINSALIEVKYSSFSIVPNLDGEINLFFDVSFALAADRSGVNNPIIETDLINFLLDDLFISLFLFAGIYTQL